jgi:hypothetical protein
MEVLEHVASNPPMKTHFFPKTFAVAALAVTGVLAMPQVSEAKPRHSSHSSKHHDDDHHHHHGSYYSYPRSSFVLSLGTGYAGRGYYYGPPGVPYYYESPGVRYYATRSVVPREYLGSDYGGGYAHDNTGAAVQSELARRGYYHGSIDGAIGPMSSRAISRYQMDHGLPVTGSITSSLLRSLGL